MIRAGMVLTLAAVLAMPAMAQVKHKDSKKAKPAKSTYVVGVSGMT